LEIYERLGLERDAADDYHQLGNIAYLRQQFDQAEAWYRKALEIKERLGHPPLLVSTLAQFGVLRRLQNRLPEAIPWLARSFAIAVEYEMRVAGQIVAHLGRIMQAMGEKDFAKAWPKEFGNPPIKLLRGALGK
jgi:tetratricopeptide (TPR) repeat protein